MATKTPLYWGSVSAIGASIAWAMLSADSIVRPDPESYRSIFFLVPWILTATALNWLHIAQRARSGRLGLAGYRLTMGAMALGGVSGTAVALGADFLTFLAFPVSVLAWIAGMAMLGMATIRAGVVSRYAGIAIIISEPLTIAIGLALSPWIPLTDEGSYSGAIGNCLAMLALGLALRDAIPAGKPVVSREIRQQRSHSI